MAVRGSVQQISGSLTVTGGDFPESSKDDDIKYYKLFIA